MHVILCTIIKCILIQLLCSLNTAETEMGFDQEACVSLAVTVALTSSAVKKYCKTL